MSLGEDIGAALPELRRQAESMMRSTVRVRRKAGTVRDPDTGKNVTAYVVIYAGKARVRMPSVQPREAVQAGQRFVETAPTLSVPIGDADAAQIQLDDEVLVLTHQPDPLRVGTVMRVVNDVDQTNSTARRFAVEVITPET